MEKSLWKCRRLQASLWSALIKTQEWAQCTSAGLYSQCECTKGRVAAACLLTVCKAARGPLGDQRGRGGAPGYHLHPFIQTPASSMWNNSLASSTKPPAPPSSHRGKKAVSTAEISSNRRRFTRSLSHCSWCKAGRGERLVCPALNKQRIWTSGLQRKQSWYCSFTLN